MNWKVEFLCPQCAAPVILEETDRLFSCAYCRVRLYLYSDTYLKYVIPCSKIPPGELFFFPYWRFKGSVFSCLPGEVRSKILDITALASDFPLLPWSLGIAPQVHPLRFLSPDIQGQFLEPSFGLSLALTVSEDHMKSLGDPAFSEPTAQRVCIGETSSLLYFPVGRRGRDFFDGVTSRPLGSLDGAQIESLLESKANPFSPIRFISALCPNCGGDLEGEKDSVVLLCRNCHSGWETSEKGLQAIEVASSRDDGEGIVYLPFWMIRVNFENNQLSSRSIPPEIDRSPFLSIEGIQKAGPELFWVPAFKVNPDLFLKLIKRMTLQNFQAEIAQTVPPKPIFAATLHLEEAVESLKAAFAFMSKDRHPTFFFASLPRIRTVKSTFVLLPFQIRGSEFVQTRMNMAIQRKAIQYGRNI